MAVSHFNRDFWKTEEETLLKEWARKAQIYHLLHLQAHRVYKKKNIFSTVPVIVLSIVAGSANFAQGMFQEWQQLSAVIIGCMNMSVGIITTLLHFLKIPELTESFKNSAIAWKRFNEYIKVELSKNPLDRQKPSAVLKYCTQQYDHLIEFSPLVPAHIIEEIRKKYNIGDLDIIGDGEKQQSLICENVVIAEDVL